MEPPLHAFPLGGEHVVFRAGLDRLHVVNASAREVLDGLAGGLTAEQLAQTWERRHGLPPQQALSLVVQTAETLASAGLTGAAPPPRPRQPLSYPQSDLACDDAAPPPVGYRIGPRSLCIRYANLRLQALLRPYLDHLRSPIAAPQLCFETLERDGRRYLLLQRRQLLEAVSDEEMILGILFHVVEAVRDDVTHLMVLHAGAVGCSDRALVFPAASGCGKSTLVAYLAHHGFDYLADDMLPVRRQDGLVDPVPGCIGLKQGSWPVVAAFRPDLLDGPAFELPGRRLRYLSPPRGAALRHAPLAVAALVFPRYRSGADASLEPLRPAQALREIVESQAYLPLPLEPARVEALVGWTARHPAYQLIYSALPEARRLLAGLVGNL